MTNPWHLPGPGGPPDLEVAQQALALLTDPEAGFQLTCAPSWAYATFPGDIAGIDQAATWVGSHGDAEGVYCAINPVDPGLDVRVRNPDVLRRRWLLIDVDRVKTAADKSLSATAAEHENALALADRVREYLGGFGWPEPGLHVDSGNGAHLFYRIDWPNDPASQKALSSLLKELARRFDGELGTLDRAVHDARRIAKVPGTWARKGRSSADRPHRIARLLSHTTDPARVTLDMARAVAGERESQEDLAPPPTPKPISCPWVLVPHASLPVDVAWARQALANECDRMRAARPGGLNNQLFASAAALGNLIAAGLLDEQEVVDALLDAGEVAGCDNPKKDRATVERGIQTGRQTPRRPEPRGPFQPGVMAGNQQGTPGETPSGRQTHPVAQSAISRAAGLLQNLAPVVLPLPTIMATEYPEPRYAVPGIISEGLNLLVGKPKLGKSWFALNVGITIAAGGVALGNIPVIAGPVLYLALEDRFRRVQSRSRKVLSGLAAEPSSNLHIAVEWPRLDAGGLDYLCEWIESRGVGTEGSSNVRLVIIDVWAKFRPVQGNTRASAYDVDYAHMAALKNVLDHYGISALVLHHTRKAAAQDAMDEVSGTAGIAGAADGVLVLTRARHQDGKELEAELLVMPRDHEEQKLALVVDQQTWVWTSQGTASNRNESRVVQAVVAIFQANAGLTMSMKTVMDSITTIPKPTASYLRTILVRLVDKGDIERVRDGHYRKPLVEVPF